MRRHPTPSATPPPVGARRGHSRLFHLRWLRRIPRNEAPPFARMRKDHRARGLSLQQLDDGEEFAKTFEKPDDQKWRKGKGFANC